MSSREKFHKSKCFCKRTKARTHSRISSQVYGHLVLSPDELGRWARAVASTYPNLIITQGCVLESPLLASLPNFMFGSVALTVTVGQERARATDQGFPPGERAATHHQHTMAFSDGRAGLAGWLDSGCKGVGTFTDEGRAGRCFHLPQGR